MSCSVRDEKRGDRTIVVLEDTESGASASILPSYGFNLFDLRLPAAGAVRSLVNAAEGWAADPSHPARHGFPVLFPFPNRIRDGRFEWGGRSFELALNKPPHAIHGFAIDAPWEVIDRGADPNGAFVTGRFRLTNQSPQAKPIWPSDGYLDIRYALRGRTLTLDATVANESERDLPYGLGFHPYFNIPFEAGGDLSRAEVVVPAAKRWVLRDSIPTGEVVPVDGGTDYRSGRSMAGLTADDVLTDLQPNAEGFTVCRLIDRSLDAEFQLGFDGHFREVVVFTPPNRPGVVAVEPYTQTTDAIHLQLRSVDAGLRVLKEGEQESMRIAMSTAG